MSFDWCACGIFTPVDVIFRNVLWLVCLRYFYSSSCYIQKCPLIGVLLNITTTGVKIPQAHQSKDISEYHNYWSTNTASTPIKVVIFRNVLWLVCLLYFYSSRCDIQKCSLIGMLAVFLLQSLWYSEMFIDWCACCIFTPVVVIFRNVLWYTNQWTFLNITTTGVKIQQAHQSMNISEYHNDWSKNTASTPIKGHFW
jgi:hypothetical protein